MNNHAVKDTYSDIRVDEKAICGFVSRLHLLADGIQGKFCVTSIQQPPDVPKSFIRSWMFPVGKAEEMKAMALKVIQEANEPWTNVYVQPCVLRSDISDHSRGKKEDIVAVLALVVDQDADTGRGGTLPLAPNMIVRTSSIPEINRQAFYVFDPSDRPSVEVADALGKMLKAATGADDCTGVIAQIYRVPGTLNWPTPNKIRRGRPKTPQPTMLEQDFNGFTSVEALRNAVATVTPAAPKISPANDNAVATRPPEPTSLRRSPSKKLLAALKSHDREGDRSPAAFQAIAKSIEEGFSDNEIAELVQAHPKGIGERYREGKDLAADIQRIREKVAATAQERDILMEEAATNRLPEGFARDSDGNLLKLSKDGSTFERLCTPIQVPARIRADDGSGWGLVVDVQAPDGTMNRAIIPAADLGAVSGDREPIAKLRDLGLEVASGKSPSEIREYLTRSRPTEIARSVEKTGWHGDAFALPNQLIGSLEGEPQIWVGDRTDAATYQSSGTLEDWQQQVAKPASDHPLLLTVMCQALSGPALAPMDSEGFGLHLHGPSSTGKSTAAFVAGSIWGPPKKQVRNWRATANGLEGVAASVNDLLLILDEIHQAIPSDVGNVLYMLSQGKGKQRAGRAGQARDPHLWRLNYLSTGEMSTIDYLKTDPKGGKVSAGQTVRCVNIAVPSGSGVFSSAAMFRSTAELADHFKAVSNKNCGTAGPTFIRRLVEAKDQSRQRLGTLKQDFMKHPQMASLISGGVSGQVYRVVDHFAVIYAVGCLACEYCILPVSTEQVYRAIKGSLDLWIDERGSTKSFEEHSVIEAVRDFLFQNMSRFPGRDQPYEVFNPSGIKVKQDGKTYFAIYRDVFDTEICRKLGMDAKSVVKRLHEAGFLIPEMQKGKIRLDKKVVVSADRRARMYCIRSELLKDEDDEPTMSTNFYGD